MTARKWFNITGIHSCFDVRGQPKDSVGKRIFKRILLSSRFVSASRQGRMASITRGNNHDASKPNGGETLGARAHFGGVVYDGARRPGGHDRLEHDPRRPRRLDRGAGWGGECLQPELCGAVIDWRRPR